MVEKKIEAVCRWNKTGFHVKAGKTYRFHASGEWDDLSHHCKADGYPSPWYLSPWVVIRRVPSARWFALIGTVEGADRFVIGIDRTWTAPRDGELWCYANDVWFMYFNNSGFVTLQIEEVT